MTVANGVVSAVRLPYAALLLHRNRAVHWRQACAHLIDPCERAELKQRVEAGQDCRNYRITEEFKDLLAPRICQHYCGSSTILV